MKIQIRHTGRVKNGKKIYDIPDLYQQQLIELEGKEFTEIIKERHHKPTMSQFGYYRGCILPVCYESEQFKYLSNKDEIHDLYFAPKFLTYVKMLEMPSKRPEEIRITRSLADLSKNEMSEFIEKVLADTQTELGIDIPPPEMFYNKYYQK